MTKKSNVDISKPFQRVGRSYPEDLKKRLVLFIVLLLTLKYTQFTK